MRILNVTSRAGFFFVKVGQCLIAHLTNTLLLFGNLFQFPTAFFFRKRTGYAYSQHQAKSYRYESSHVYVLSYDWFYGVYQMGDVYARSWWLSGTSFGISMPKKFET